MPTVPTLTRRVALQPLPNARLTAGETELSSGAETARAEAGFFGAGAAAATHAYGQVVKAVKQRADETALLDASNQLSDWTTNALYGQDGALTKKGADSFGLPETVRTGYSEQVGKIAQGLGNDDQRFAFQKMALQHGEQLELTLQRHVAEQRTVYEGKELEDFKQNRISDAVANSQDPVAVGQALHAGLGAIKLHAPRLGLGPEALAATERDFTTRVHIGVIESLLEKDHAEAAQVWYEESKSEISGEAQTKIEHALETAGTDRAGLQTAIELWTKLGPPPGDDQTPINLDAMEDAARTRFADNPRALEATTKFLRERKAAVDASRHERETAIASELWGAVAKGTALDQIRTTPAYLNAPGHVQAQISDAIVSQAERRASRDYALESRAYTREQRAAAEAARQEKATEDAHWDEYWGIASDPAALAQTDANDIIARRGELGVRHVDRLLAIRAQLQKPGAVRKAEIDNDQFADIARSAGLNPDNKKNQPMMTRLGQLRDRVEAEIAVEEQPTTALPKGRQLTRDEKGKLMQRIVDQHVLSPGYFGTSIGGSERPAATVLPAERASAYVPIDQIPTVSAKEGQLAPITELLNYVRGLTPQTQRMTDTELRSRFGSRISHAYALRLMGASRAEIENALRGQ